MRASPYQRFLMGRGAVVGSNPALSYAPESHLASTQITAPSSYGVVRLRPAAGMVFYLPLLVLIWLLLYAACELVMKQLALNSLHSELKKLPEHPLPFPKPLSGRAGPSNPLPPPSSSHPNGAGTTWDMGLQHPVSPGAGGETIALAPAAAGVASLGSLRSFVFN